MKTTLRTTAFAIALGLFGLVGTAGAQQRPQDVKPQVQAPQQGQAHAPQAQAQAHAPQAPAAQPGQAAHPEMRTPTQTRAALVAAAQKTSIPHFVTPAGKVVYNPQTREHIDAVEALSTPGSGILQIMQIDGVQHTLGHFEGQYIHFQYSTGTNNWRIRPWTDGLRPSGRRMFGAMIQLSPEEAANMRTRLSGIFAEQGPENRAGQGWADGHIGKSVGVNYFNCASAWCEMPIGTKGESVARVIGIPSTGDPYTLQRTLETHGNEKIVGIGLFGPKQEGLGQNPTQRFAP